MIIGQVGYPNLLNLSRFFLDTFQALLELGVMWGMCFFFT